MCSQPDTAWASKHRQGKEILPLHLLFVLQLQLGRFPLPTSRKLALLPLSKYLLFFSVSFYTRSALQTYLRFLTKVADVALID